jgi:Zn-finger nucleic acid-binding protein
MFVGSKFCSHCGERSASADILTEGDPGECPRCNTELQSLKVGTTIMRECLRCGGFWVGVETFERLCTDKEEQSAVISYAGSKPSELTPLTPINYVPCPDCKQLMNRSNFARVSGVIIDLCKQHGVWFDAEELPKIIDFIDNGGLARAREKERISLEDERGRLRDERRQLAMMESGGGDYSGDRPRDGFGGVIASLFDLS